MSQIQIVNVDTEYDYSIDRLNIKLTLLDNNQPIIINVNI